MARVVTATVAIEVRTPFAGRELLAFLGHRAIAGVERIDGSGYRRTVALAHGPGAIRIDLPDLAGDGGRGTLPATLHAADPADLDAAVVLCRRLVDADADPVAVDGILATDPALAGLATEVPGIRVPGAVDGAEILFRALWGQQVSVAAARTALARLTIEVGEQLDEPLAGLTHLFPTPAAVAGLGDGPDRRAATAGGNHRVGRSRPGGRHARPRSRSVHRGCGG